MADHKYAVSFPKLFAQPGPRCPKLQHRTGRITLQCVRRVHGPEVRHLMDVMDRDANIARPSAAQSKVASEVARVAAGAVIDTFVTFPGPGVEGIVLVRRIDAYQPWAVWRWATAYTDGKPVATQSGAMLWSGGYWERHEDAERDLMERPR
jgi:hypothetical protein